MGNRLQDMLKAIQKKAINPFGEDELIALGKKMFEMRGLSDVNLLVNWAEKEGIGIENGLVPALKQDPMNKSKFSVLVFDINYYVFLLSS